MFHSKIVLHKLGQATSEYVITFFLVIAVISAMSVYVKRSLQGRIWDARNYMIHSIATSNTATLGNVILQEYEPYYVQTQSNVDSLMNSVQTLQGGGTTGIFGDKFTDQVRVTTDSNQLPPRDFNLTGGN